MAAAARPFGEEIREQLDYIPASLIVIQHVRPKYACEACQAHVVIADRLPEPIEKGLPGPGLLAHVIVSKYADHLPLYRQERILAREGVAISRQTMCGWMARCAELLKPIYDAMVKAVLRSKVIQTDDTPVDVLDPGREGTLQGRIWIAIGDRDHPYSVYDFTPNRAGDGPARFFRGYAGYLQADAYSGYDALFQDGDVIEVGCSAHARRKFYEARTTDPRHSHIALAYLRRLYIVESDAKEAKLDDDARRVLRQERSVPILEELFAWLERVRAQVLPRSPMGGAIGYALNNKAALLRYTEQGFLEIDNNASERGEKTIALGRKNWLFFGSEGGGATAAILFSLTETCRRLGVEPWAYLRDVLDRVSTHPASRIDELLPDRWEAIRRVAKERHRPRRRLRPPSGPVRGPIWGESDRGSSRGPDPVGEGLRPPASLGGCALVARAECREARGSVLGVARACRLDGDTWQPAACTSDRWASLRVRRARPVLHLTLTVLLQVHLNGDMGSPRVSGSIKASRARTKWGS